MRKTTIAMMFGVMMGMSSAAFAGQDVVISSGKAGGAYNNVFGTNLAGASIS